MTAPPAQPYGFPKDRVLAFSDGVFAVALTLLAVDLVTSGVRDFDTKDWRGLAASLLAAAYTFFSIGTFWVAHHNEMNMVERVTREFLWLNLLFLFFIMLMPFAAALLDRQWRDAAPGLAANGWRFGEADLWTSRIPFLGYTLDLMLAGLGLEALWLHVRVRRAELVTAEHQAEVDTVVWLNAIIPVAAALILVLGLVWDARRWAWAIVAVPFLYMALTLVRAAMIRGRRRAAAVALASPSHSV